MSRVGRHPSTAPDVAARAGARSERGQPSSSAAFEKVVKAKGREGSAGTSGKLQGKRQGERRGESDSSPSPMPSPVEGRPAREGRAGGLEPGPLPVPSTVAAAGATGEAAGPRRTAALRRVAAWVDRLVAGVARAAEVSAASSRPRLQVEIDLGRLGGGRVRVEKGKGGLEVRLELDGARARELATAGLDDLRQKLAGRGLEIARLDVPAAQTPRQSSPAAESHASRGGREEPDPRDDGQGTRDEGGRHRGASDEEVEETP